MNHPAAHRRNRDAVHLRDQASWKAGGGRNLAGRIRLRPALPWCLVAIVLCFASTTAPGITAQPAQGNGYADHSYVASGEINLTGDKPESKLWWNDCAWWASMFNQETRAYHIYRLNLNDQAWEDTGMQIDERNASRTDALWDEAEQKLYVVSHVTTSSPRTARAGDETRLYRYSYDARLDRYSLDAGFPVVTAALVPRVQTINRDSIGRLWTAYVWNAAVQVQYSDDDGLTWSPPAALPLEGAAVVSADIAAVIAFDQHIGVAWTNQLTGAIYFAIHEDDQPADAWTAEVVIMGTRQSDDHLNMAVDAQGRVYLATKTSNSRGADPFILIHVRQPDGIWATHVFGYQRDDHTRPLILVDEEHELLYVFATSPQTGGNIYYKTTPLDDINFEAGVGTPILQFPNAHLNNTTSTKQMLNSFTGLVILASAEDTRRYYHNYLTLGADEGAEEAIGASCAAEDFTPAAAIYYVSSQTTVNVRTEPNTSASVFTQLEPGSEVRYVGEIEGTLVEGNDRWAQIEIDEQIYYVHSLLLSELPPS